MVGQDRLGRPEDVAVVDRDLGTDPRLLAQRLDQRVDHPRVELGALAALQLGDGLGDLAGTAVLLAVPLVVVVARGWRPRPGHLRAVVVYGVVPLAGAQVCYFGAVERLSVGVALLIEYTAPVLLLAWIWARTAARPRPATLVGAGLAVVGLVLVLDVARGAAVDLVGVAWGLALVGEAAGRRWRGR